jgi:molybdenum cofactor cytidylyltransferase
MGLAGVILAAGESTRMGRDKALLPWPPDRATESEHVGPDAPVRAGEPGSPSAAPASTRPSASGTLLSNAIEALSRYCDLVIVVGGKNAAALAPVVYGCGAFLLLNPDPDLGQFSSLQCGLREVLKRGWDTAMITLVDRPSVAADTLGSLVNTFTHRSHDIWAIVPEYQGKHGHPIVIGREMIEAFLKAPGASNARDVEHMNQRHISYFAVSDLAVIANVDTPEDYASLHLQKS